jgi:hypothetical protein
MNLKDTFEDVMSKHDKQIARTVMPWGAIKNMRAPFKALDDKVVDSRGELVCNAERGLARDIAKALNEVRWV